MAAVRGRDTKSEVMLRSLLHRRGLRFRKHYPLPGRPDIVFPRPRVAVFVDGDYWHGNAWRARGLGSFEDQFRHNNGAWWKAKIKSNVERDRRVDDQLRAAGWRVIRIWESDLLQDPASAVSLIARVVRNA